MMPPTVARRSTTLFGFALAAAIGALSAVAGAAAQTAASDPPPLLPRLPVVGLAHPVELRPTIGEIQWWRGDFVWRHRFSEEGATFLKVHLSGFRLAPDERLEILGADGRVRETLTGRGPKNRVDFWSLPVRGPEVTVRFLSPRPFARLPFVLDQLLVGDRDLAPPVAPSTWAEIEDPESVCQPADFEDVICYQDDPVKWSNVVASVGVMQTGGQVSLFCSGSNLDGNVVLTNAHCVDTQNECDNTDFVFRYWRTGCNDGSPPTDDWVAFRCDELLVTQPFISCDQGLADLDFSLFSVLGDPAAEFGSVSPDPDPLTDGEAIYIIQHPSGRPHEITHGAGANVDVDGTVLRYYDTLDTEGGSSGSPIFREADGLLVGLHHCGGCSTPGVGNRGMLMSDIYPHIEPFLDLGAMFADGFESGDTSAWDDSSGGE